MAPPDQNQPFTPIDNPFYTGAPVRGPRMFFGREDQFAYVRQRLAAEKEGIVLLFVGERRSGKTSILFQILDGKLGEGFLPVFIDMQQLAGVAGDREFFAHLAKITLEHAHDERLVLEYYNFAEGNPLLTYDQLLVDVQRLFPQRLIFLIDEADILRTRVEQGNLSGAVLVYLASLLESRRVSFCLTGSRGLGESEAEGWRHLLGKGDFREVSFLGRDDTLRLIQKPVEGQVFYGEEVVEAIYQLSYGQPFYTQIICTNVVDYLNGARRNHLAREDLDEVVRTILDNPPPQLVYDWDRMNLQEKIALSLLSEVSQGPLSAATPDDLVRRVAENNYPLRTTAEELHVTLENLYQRKVLDRDQTAGYYFLVDLFRLWIKRARSIWRLVEEMRPRRRERRWIAAAAGGMAIIALGILLQRALQDEPTNLATARSAEPAAGEIWVDRYPEGAEVLVDGQMQRRTTPTLTDPLKPGMHVLEVRHPKYRALIVTLKIEPGRRDTVSTSLQRLKGRLSVTVKQAGARVRVQGEEKDTSGSAPLADLELPTGAYKVTANAEGYVERSQNAMVEEGKPVSLNFDLTANVGSVYLVSYPAGARILVAGTPTGKQTPDLLGDLPVGRHPLRLDLKDYEWLDTVVHVVLGRTDTLQLGLMLKPAVLSLQSKPSGADIYLGQGTVPWGRTPVIQKRLKSGTHVLRVAYPGFKEDTLEVNLKPAQEFERTLALVPYKGTLRIQGYFGTAQLIDEQTGEQREVEIPGDYELPVGKYRIKGKTAEERSEVSRDRLTKVTVK
jgi:hypothetical protein